jgi:CheY-like chemotaxis protein
MLDRSFSAVSWPQRRRLGGAVFAPDERLGRSRARVLIVEDDTIVAFAMQRDLEARGYAIAASTDKGEDAVLLAETLEPDLVLMDVRLRGRIDGVEAAEAIRARLGTPILFVTAHADGAIRARIGALPDASVLAKPYTADQLERAIASALDRP